MFSARRQRRISIFLIVFVVIALIALTLGQAPQAIPTSFLAPAFV